MSMGTIEISDRLESVKVVRRHVLGRVTCWGLLSDTNRGTWPSLRLYIQ
jgi:hypothetical protein